MAHRQHTPAGQSHAYELRPHKIFFPPPVMSRKSRSVSPTLRPPGGSFRSADFDGDVDAAVDAGLLLRPERPEEAAEAGAALARELQRERAREQLRAAKLAV